MIKVTDDNIKEIVLQRIKEDPKADINDIDVSGVTCMSFLFYREIFYGDISRWDTSNVKYMNGMFELCIFNGNISGWDVSSCVDMSYMFYKNKEFNQDLSCWKINKYCCYESIFKDSIYDKILPKGMDPKIAFRGSYNNYYEKKLEKTIKVL